MSESEEKIAREVYDYINSCSAAELLRVYFLLFGETILYTQAAKEIENKT